MTTLLDTDTVNAKRSPRTRPALVSELEENIVVLKRDEMTTDQRANHNDAVKRSQAARKDAVTALIKAHPEEFARLWAEKKVLYGISDRAGKREEREREEFARLQAKYGSGA